MTQQEILEYNKRCAEFLGGVYEIIDAPFAPQWFNLPFSKRGIPEGLLKFHSDWNWIHEVVKGIKQLISKWEHIYTMSPQEQKIDYQLLKEDELANSIQHLTIYAQKETVVEAINQFLIWYNENANKKD